MSERTVDVGIVGGGLGGLATAALLAARGLEVVVLERATGTGGRASTRERDGFFFNEGAHALYRGGAAARVLKRLGVKWRGRRPAKAGLAVRDGEVHKLPTTLGSLLATSLVGWSGKLEGARVLARLGAFDARAADGVPWDEWACREVPDAGMRGALDAFVRVSTYAHAPTRASAGATLDQLRLAGGPGVAYVDGGWATLVAAVSSLATGAGARIATKARVESAKRDGDTWVLTTGDERVRCTSLVLATGPSTASSIVGSDALASWANAVTPVRAACLDIALSKLPRPKATFALGVDAPVYLSVHSATARVAPPGAALVSTMKYLTPGAPLDPKRDRAELEALLDLLQPGWRDVTLDTQWLPAVVASNVLLEAKTLGTRGRPGPKIPDVPSAWVVGDWVGGEGMLLDASLASAERVADDLASSLALARVA